jgi:hypothetical protein
MALLNYISSVFSKKPLKEEVKLVEEQQKRPNAYTFNDKDRETARKMRMLQAELERQRKVREAYLDKLRDDVKIAELKFKCENVGKEYELVEEKEEEEEGSFLDKMFAEAMGKIVNLNTIIPQQKKEEKIINIVDTTDFKDFENSATKKAEILSQGELPKEEEEKEEEEALDSRFTDEQIKEYAPKMLNKEQLSMIKGLTADELLQMHDVIKKDL